MEACTRLHFTPVAQVDRAPHYECGGPRFESWQGYWSAYPRGIRRPTDARRHWPLPLWGSPRPMSSLEEDWPSPVRQPSRKRWSARERRAGSNPASSASPRGPTDTTPASEAGNAGSTPAGGTPTQAAGLLSVCKVHNGQTKRPSREREGLSAVSTRRAPEGIRTPDLLIRSQMLYPAELRALVQLSI